MNRKLLAAAVAILVVSEVELKAGDFAFLDLKAPQTSVGSFIDAKDGSSAAGGLVDIITHKRRYDNTLLGAVSNGWIPLTLGGTLGQGLGGPSVAMGTGFNLFPAAQASLYSIINAVSKSDQLTGLKVALASSSPEAAIFVGPQASLVVRGLDRMGTMLTWFVGASIQWK